MATFDPGPFGFPTVDPNSITNYNFAVAALAGLTDEESDHLNYTLSKDGTTGSILGVGVPVKRNFKTNEFEYYVQDSFKMMPNLTITAGLRHTILQTPYETNGQQVQPTINIHDWFNTRAAQAAQGNSVQPEISFAPSGQARGKKPFYPMNWGNIAPRFAIAFAPAPEEGTWMKQALRRLRQELHPRRVRHLLRSLRSGPGHELQPARLLQPFERTHQPGQRPDCRHNSAFHRPAQPAGPDSGECSRSDHQLPPDSV